MSCSLTRTRRMLHGFDDPQICAASAHVSVHMSNDLLPAGVRCALKKCGCRENHSRSAISALEGFEFQKGLLHRMERSILRQALYGDYVFARSGTDLHPAGTHRRSVDQNGTGTTLALSATVFGAGQAEVVAQDVQQGRL